MINDKILTDPTTAATALHAWCVQKYGAGYLNWEPETLDFELPETTPKVNKEKLQAISTILTTEQFYTYWEPFQVICNTLDNEDPGFGLNLPTDPIQIAWALTEAALVDTSFGPFSNEVKIYIRTVFKMHGVIKTPKIISQYILSDYDLSEDCSDAQKKIMDEYEKELIEIVAKRLKKLKDDLE